MTPSMPTPAIVRLPQPEFTGEVAVEEALLTHDLRSDRLQIEVTESAVMADAARAADVLSNLASRGVTVAIDDFGTGYSSLTSLERLPLSRVKLDRGVLAEVDSNPRAASIARSMIGLCQGLGLQVTAEGVERATQLDFLANSGDVSVQGYLVARPMDADGILEAVGRMEPRMRVLLEAGERGRTDASLYDPDGTVIPLRRRPR